MAGRTLFSEECRDLKVLPAGVGVPKTGLRFMLLPVLLVLLNGLLHVPEVVVGVGHALSRTFLVAAMAAIGIKTHLKDILSVGWKPVALMVLETVFLAVLVYILLLQA